LSQSHGNLGALSRSPAMMMALIRMLGSITLLMPSSQRSII